jgi:hypothetical protein
MPKIVRSDEVILSSRNVTSSVLTEVSCRHLLEVGKGLAYVIGGLLSSFRALILLRVIGLMVHADRRMDKLDRWLIPRCSSHFAENL